MGSCHPSTGFFDHDLSPFLFFSRVTTGVSSFLVPVRPTLPRVGSVPPTVGVVVPRGLKCRSGDQF